MSLSMALGGTRSSDMDMIQGLNHLHDCKRLFCSRITEEPVIILISTCSYQRIYFRNVNHPFIRASITSRKQDQKGPEKQSTTTEATGNEPPSHVFDGMHLTQETAAYQLCDITDPMLKEMIEDENSIRDECNVS